ncbi:hypothetical protein CDL12_25806 [Handroanthus impetiginosus]|uniref:Bifunctional inhibitor/plant lipid transfer protein/seed storage helical domain-containing protein n=1 Tax=Handroanthus impetiginosus TaxID=429701 RepID=A0A2G9G904_9LAMI|nr:hypothetical protein CDL12_25806 [Handroanthus impetiginosus]
MASHFLILSLSISISLLLLLSPVSAQTTSACTPSMITTFTPCMNFITNSTVNGSTTPTADCCNSLKSLMINGKDCLCLIATAGVPFQVPINRTAAISLPRLCNMPGVPLQCKASGAPVPAPGPIANGPTLSPNAAAPSPSAKGLPEPLSPSSSPEPDSTVDGSPTGNTGNTGNTGSRAGPTPSAAHSSCSVSFMLLLIAVYGAIANLKYY